VTRPTRLVLAVSAVLLLAAFGIAQATDYANTPLLPDPAVDRQADLDAVARATGCGDLRQQYVTNHMVWKGGVRDGHDAEVEPNLEAMRVILRRIQTLSEQGRCGG
jgi:hypothetical protein